MQLDCWRARLQIVKVDLALKKVMKPVASELPSELVKF